ncbi:uncharacterized protein LOC129803366 [Phlebotomus papatasi]|uniref:uncharacterized protein LOC129803366 n=1 Tax=Phlebotomus papatasi TaxID=29031 RepID=UPI002483ADDC|nr:uncharacterized protein LOC129803366 [Phlebotomus papatasi]
MELQDQIYVLAGVFGGFSLILFLFVCYLMLSLSEIHSQMKSQNAQDRYDRRPRPSRNDLAYANPSIVPGEELNRRGYQMTDGQEDFAPSGLAAIASNRYRSQMSIDVGTKDASRDFSSILNNEEMIFAGDGRASGQRSRSISAPPPPLGKPSSFNENISYQGAHLNPLGQRQDRGYFNRVGGY